VAGRLIRLFLVDGKPDGIRTAEVSNMTLYGTFFPRTELEKFALREVSNKPGVYMISGPDEEDPEEKILYIGEGDPVLPRLKNHAGKKDFWTDAIVFSSKDDYLTKTQIQYLEAELIKLAKEAHRAKLDNGNVPTKPNISEVDKAEVDQFLEGIKLLLLTVGINFLESRTLAGIESMLPTRVFELMNKNATGKMAIIDNKYVVLKGSTAVLKNRPSIPSFLVKLRQSLVDTGIVVDKGDGVYTFEKNATFNSPSYAAVAIVGGRANGRKLWKHKGKSLNEIENSSDISDDESD
jgi:hypothetical protein